MDKVEYDSIGADIDDNGAGASSCFAQLRRRRTRERLERLADSGLFTHIVCTDSHPRSHELTGRSGLEVVSIAELLADFLAA